MIVSRKKKFLKLLLILFLILVIIAFSQNIFEWLINPIAQILWMLVKLFLSIDQQILWSIVIFGFIFVALLFIPKNHNHSESQYSFNNDSSEERTLFWKRKILSAMENESDRIFLEEKINNFIETVNSDMATDKLELIRLIPQKRTSLRSTRNLFYRIRYHFYKNSENIKSTNDIIQSVELNLNNIEEAIKKFDENSRNSP